MIDVLVRFILPAALSVLPAAMNTPEARAMLLAIAIQESKVLYRRQQNYGPARSFWQFEKGGVRAVGKHLASRAHLEAALRVLRYEGSIGKTAELQYAIQDNDVLACVYARLLLYTLPGHLPRRHEHEKGWAQYLEAWRPGKPRPLEWPANFSEAWDRIDKETIK